MKKIKIKSFGLEKLLINWYSDKKGEVFEVCDEDEEVYIVYKNKNHQVGLVLKEHAEEV